MLLPDREKDLAAGGDANKGCMRSGSKREDALPVAEWAMTMVVVEALLVQLMIVEKEQVESFLSPFHYCDLRGWRQ